MGKNKNKNYDRYRYGDIDYTDIKIGSYPPKYEYNEENNKENYENIYSSKNKYRGFQLESKYYAKNVANKENLCEKGQYLRTLEEELQYNTRIEEVYQYTMDRRMLVYKKMFWAIFCLDILFLFTSVKISPAAVFLFAAMPHIITMLFFLCIDKVPEPGWESGRISWATVLKGLGYSVLTLAVTFVLFLIHSSVCGGKAFFDLDLFQLLDLFIQPLYDSINNAIQSFMQSLY